MAAIIFANNECKDTDDAIKFAMTIADDVDSKQPELRKQLEEEKKR